jgi:hypothetical protein
MTSRLVTARAVARVTAPVTARVPSPLQPRRREYARTPICRSILDGTARERHHSVVLLVLIGVALIVEAVLLTWWLARRYGSD